LIEAFRKSWWIAKKSANLLIVSIRVFVYCLIHPKKLFEFTFSIFSTINKFYQSSHGRLLDFKTTKIFQDLNKNPVFARCNFFLADSTVTHLAEIHILATLTCYLKPKRIFEIGTYNGFTTLHFAYNSPGDCTIYTLDLPPHYDTEYKNKSSEYSYDDWLVVQLSMDHIAKRIFKGDPNAAKIKELFGDSATFDFSPYYGKIDLIFIDGSHSYPYIKSDTENAFKMLSDTGIIVWHDFDYVIHKDVFRYLNELSKERKIYSIANTRFAVFGNSL